MSDELLMGCLVGYIVFIMVEELKLPICELCVVFWCSLVLGFISSNFISVGAINLIALSVIFILKRIMAGHATKDNSTMVDSEST